MNDNATVQVNDLFTVEKFDGEILLYSEDSTQAVYLNDAAHAVYLLCKENMNIGQMIDYLQQVYPEQREQIKGDVLSALEMLQSNNVMNVVDAD